MLRLHRSEDHGWYVSRHVAEHNHPLSVSCGEKREWNSHSKIEQCVKDMIRFLRENNVSLSRVHCIMGSSIGEYEDSLLAPGLTGELPKSNCTSKKKRTKIMAD